MSTANPMLQPPGRWTRRALPAAIMLALVVVAPLPALAAAAADQATSDQSEREAQRRDQEGAQDLGKIEVTATGRVQQIITVPYNITAVTGADIEHAHMLDNAELFRSVPGVNVVDSGPRNSSVVNSIRIRGLNVDSSALGDYAVTSTAPVATYIDSTPLFANFLLFDINRVEVLKGPQGTLYGSGSLGGTVRYILNAPDLSGFYGSVSGSLSKVQDSGSIGNSESLMLNVPLGATAALRVDAMRNDFPGVTDYVSLYKLGANGQPVAPEGTLSPAAEYTVKRDADTVDQNYGRIALLWKPNDRFDLQFGHMAQADRFGSRRGTSVGTDGFGRPYKRNELGAAMLEPAKRHASLTSLEANVDLGFATLTSSTSSYNHRGDNTSDNTGFYAMNEWYSSLYYNYPRPMSAAARIYGDKGFTQEFRLVSRTGGAFDYIVGLYHQNQKTTTGQNSWLVGFKDWWDAAYPAFAAAVNSDNDFHYLARGKYRENAIYGQGTWHVTDDLQFTLGLRSFRDRYEANQAQDLPLWSSLSDPATSSDRQSHSKTLFLGNMSWWFSPSHQLYATVSEGYRRGGANGTPETGFFAEDPAWQFYESDTVRNAEIGLKGMGEGFTYTADVFQTRWKDPQINTSTTNWGFFAVANMGRAETKGLELEVQGRLGETFGYALGYTYTDAQLTREAISADGLYVISPKGARLPGTSKQRVNVAGNWFVPTGAGALNFRIDGAWQSSAPNALSVNPLFAATLPAFSVWNALASYSRGDWTASLWLKNIANTRGVTGIYKAEYMGTNPAEGFFGNSSKAITTIPRTLGATFTWNF